MTNEECIKMLKSKLDGNTDTSYEWCECVRLAIKALEQQPCEDCISREDALREACEFVEIGYNGKGIFRRLKDLPSVAPQPKRGKWEVIRKEYEFMGGVVNEPQGCKCSNCGEIVKFKSDFCPNCGCYCGGDDNVDE